MSFRSITSIAALVALAGLASAAHAQCSVYRLNVPDFDQKRLHNPPASIGLPGDGAMYCSPTSAANYLAYLSNIGYAAAFDGPRNWQSQSNYDDVTDMIEELGALMSTSATGGTGFVEHSEGINAWLEARGLDDDFLAGGVSPSNGGIVGSPLGFHQLLRFGSLPMVCMGRYEYLPPNLPTPGLPARWDRTSGHAMTITRVYDACDPNPTLFFRNPSSGGDSETTQSQFLTHSLITEEFSAFFTSDDGNVWRTLWEIIVPGSSTRRMIDGMYFITPLHGITVDATRGEVSIQNTSSLEDLNLSNGIRPTHSAPGTTFQRVALSPLPGIGAAVVRGRSGDTLNRLDLADGTMVPLRTLVSAGPLVFDPYGDLYIADGSTLVRLRMTSSGGMEHIASVPLPSAPSALAFDDSNAEVIISWSGGGMNSIARIPSSLASPSTLQFFAFDPQFVGDVSVAVSPLDGSIFASSAAGPGIMHLLRGPNGNLHIATFICPSEPAPRDLHVDHRGRLIFSSRGVMHEWIRTAAGGWGPNLSSWIAGRPAGAQFALFTARNGAPYWAGTRADVNDRNPIDLGASIIECVADMDDGSGRGFPDGGVTIDDLLYYLKVFDEGGTRADVDGGDGSGIPDGGVTIDDLLYYLLRFDAGC